ncbi:MAG: TlpA disulfide reductase family protein [Eubacteriales bacterium]|nr:TlpA disulfide reductase family protein [Eubacteriales bacterium]
MNKLMILLVCLLLLVGCSAKSTDTNPTEPPKDVTPTDDATPTDQIDGTAPSDQKVLKFSSVDQNGNTVTEDILDGKSVVLINFWATWCSPCVAELPYLEQLYKDYQDRGVLIMGVMVDGTVDDASNLIESAGITYPIITVDGDLLELSRTMQFVPTTIFVNENGVQQGDNIIGSNTYEQWAEMIENLLP